MTFPEFTRAFVSAFTDGHRRRDAVAQLKKLRQTGRCVDYSTQFRALAAQTGYDMAALCDQYYDGLKDSVKDEVARIERPTNLADFELRCNEIDRRLNERTSEAARRSSANQNQRKSSTQSHDNATSTQNNTSSNSSSNSSRRKKNVNKKGPLTKDEKERRRAQGLCLYCGEVGCPGKDTTDNCPQLTSRNQRTMGRGQNRA